MGFFNKREKRTDVTVTNDLVEDVVLRSLLSGEDINATKALSIPAVASAVSRIANMVAVLPIKLYETKTDKLGVSTTKELVKDKRVFLLNTDSGDTLDQFAFKRNIAKDYLLEKGAFIYIKKVKGDVSELRYVPPRQMFAVINKINPLEKDGQYMVLDKHYELFDFVAVLRDTEDGILGKPLTNQINDVLSTAVSNILYEMGIVKKGGTKKGFLQSEKTLSTDAMAQLKKAWRELYSNTSENVIVLNSGLKFQEASDNSVDLQIDQRKKQLFKEINDVFGIHSDNFNDVFREAILPVLEAIESALNKTLLTEKEKPTLHFAFDKREILKAEIKDRYEAYKLASETGWLTKNEIRQDEDLAPIEGLNVVSMGLGDVLYDVDSKSYYTPNTGATKAFDEPAKDATVDTAKDMPMDKTKTEGAL